MRPFARISLAIALLAWPAAASAQPTTDCTHETFGVEVIFGDATTSVCPKPADPTIDALHQRVVQTPATDTRAFFDVLVELRDHHRPSSSIAGSAWNEALVRHLDRVLEQAKRGGRPLLAAFADARTPADGIDPAECLFVTGDAGQDGYACVELQGAQPASTSQLAVARLSVRDYADAYAAYRALRVARAALLKLEVPAIDRAIARLSLAQQRWNNLRTRGYLQYPWELALSSAFDAYAKFDACFATDVLCTGEEGLDPERVRLIALHPGVGAGFRGLGWKGKPSADATLALSLELIGFTAYSQDFSSYWGLSAGALVDDGDFGDLRLGASVHFTRWFHGGYFVAFMREPTRGDATALISFDLGTALGMSFLE